jgi:predicted nucleic acid-binding protein
VLDANDVDPSHSVERVEVVILGRVRVNNLWIAAVAASRGLPVVTQDDDFDALNGVAGVDVIRV